MDSALPELPHMARHALAAAAELGRLADGARLSSADIADRIGAPRPVLAKVLRELSLCGVVDGLKGHHGGYRLARPPSAVQLLEVILCATGERPARGGDLSANLQCALRTGRCNPKAPCRFHAMWSAATEPVRCLLAQATLADLLAGHRVPEAGEAA